MSNCHTKINQTYRARMLKATLVAIICFSYQLSALAELHPSSNYRALPTPAEAADIDDDPNMEAIQGSGIYFGNWILATDGTIKATEINRAEPAGFTFEILVEDEGMMQRLITNNATGKQYYQMVIADERAATSLSTEGHNFTEVGKFSESFVPVHSAGGELASYLGMRCLTSCIEVYQEAPETQFESSTKIQIGTDAGSTLRNNKEKIRIKSLKWDTGSSTSDPWAVFGTVEANNDVTYGEGFTTYADIWRAEYDTGLDKTTGNNITPETNASIKADFTRVTLITEDMNPYYTYTNAQHYFSVGESASNNINASNATTNLAKIALAKEMAETSRFTEATALKYIETYMEYTVLEATGFRIDDGQGLLLHDAQRSILRGAAVKAGKITYLNSGQSTAPFVEWEDGDTISRYRVHADMEKPGPFSHMLHEEVQNRSSTIDPFANSSTDERLASLYFFTADQGTDDNNQIIPNRNTHDDTMTREYDIKVADNLSRVGDQFKIEPHHTNITFIDVLDVFDPWATISSPTP